MTSKLLRAADLLYDDATHTSQTPDGRDVPHVTHILRATGVSVDFEALAAKNRDLAQAIDYKRALGTAAHQDCHSYDDCDLDWPAFAAACGPTVPYVEAWAAFRTNLRLTPVHRERRVFHPVDWYTGKLDGIFVQDDNFKRRILVDIKLGDPDDSGCAYQLAAYEQAYLLEHPDEPIAERWGVVLDPSLAVPYRIYNYSDRTRYPEHWLDYQKFKAFCVTFRAQAARRRAA